MSPRSSEQFEKMRSLSKTKIMVTALELFAVDGYYNTSISKIAKNADVSKGLMYNYFNSKEELLKEVVLLSIKDAKESSDNMLLKMQEASPNEILLALFELFFTVLKENKTMWKLTMSLSLQVSNIPSITNAVTQIYENFFKELEYILQICGYKNPNLEARLLAAQLDGVALHYIVFSDNYNLSEIKQELIKKYCNYE